MCDLSGEEICFDIKILTIQYGSDSQWLLGTCNSIGKEYKNFKKYIDRCCLKPGQYTLTCINTKNPYGWGDGYVEIQGHRYCDDFMSYRLLQKITIRSKFMIIILIGIFWHINCVTLIFPLDLMALNRKYAFTDISQVFVDESKKGINKSNDTITGISCKTIMLPFKVILQLFL